MRAADILDVIFDMRSLQDEAYRTRGVGRVASMILAHARSVLAPAAACRLIGLVDRRLPELVPEHRALVDEVRYAVPRKKAAAVTVFVSLSPMTHDPIFVARLLDDTQVVSACVFYDFIPLAEPARYFPEAVERLTYSLCLYWLSHYRLFASISATSARKLSEHLSISPSEIVTIGAPLDPIFVTEEALPGARRSVLVIGGGDSRKNVECAIRAHAQSALFAHEKIRLVITGDYSGNRQRDLRNLYKTSGGRMDLFTLAGHVSQETLATLYRNAFCLACMSRAEGFSLPLIEAMASGTPIVASDILAHRELVKLPGYLLPCDDDATLRQRLEHLWHNREEAERFVELHNAVWQQFKAKNLASRFWSAVIERTHGPAAAPHAPAVLRPRRPRIAFLTPLPPARSGVADYTVPCLKELARLANVTVYTNTPSPAPVDGVTSIKPMSAFPHVSPDFDRVISVLGNSHFHLDIFQHLQRHGGAAIQHDNRMLGFYAILLGKSRAEEVAARELGRPLRSGELDQWLADEAKLEATLLGEIAAFSDPLFLHSSRTAQIVRERFAVSPTVLPFAIYRQWRENDLSLYCKTKARRDLGIAPFELAIISLGYVHNSKAPMECIAALELVRSWGVPARLYFVGEVGTQELEELVRFCRGIGVADSVRFVAEYTSEATYRNYLLAADLAVQLRTHLLGGLSGALLDCIAAGLPTVANTDLAESMEAPSYVERVSDRPSPVLIANAMMALIERKNGLMRAHRERKDFAREHNFAVYARRLCESLALNVPTRSAA